MVLIHSQGAQWGFSCGTIRGAARGRLGGHRYLRSREVGSCLQPPPLLAGDICLLRDSEKMYNMSANCLIYHLIVAVGMCKAKGFVLLLADHE